MKALSLLKIEANDAIKACEVREAFVAKVKASLDDARKQAEAFAPFAAADVKSIIAAFPRTSKEDAERLRVTAVDVVAQMKKAEGELAPIYADALEMHYASLRAAEAIMDEYRFAMETDPESRLFQEAEKICRRAGVDAYKLAADARNERAKAHGLSTGKLVSRDQFNFMTPSARLEFVNNGGRIA